MALQQPGEAITPTAQEVARALDALHGGLNFAKPYLNTREAAAYTGRSMKAFYEFLRRWNALHEGDGLAVIRCGDGTIARRDLDRVKRQRWTAKRGPKGRPARQQQRG